MTNLAKIKTEVQDETNDIVFYGDKQVRWYQIACHNQAVKALEEGIKRILIVQPTGTGKTLTIVHLLSNGDVARILGVEDRKLRVLFIAHLHRLLTQAEKTFAEENKVELILQSMMSPISDEVMKQGFDIVVMDEAHHEAASSMQYQLDCISDKPFIGLTATPDRADRFVIKFEEIICPLSREQAVEEGFLAETYLRTFVDGSERSKSDIAIDILDRYADEMKGTLIFLRTKREVLIVNNYLLSRGYSSVGVLTQTNAELNEVLNDFSAGRIKFVVSCNKISEGIDVKNCTDVLIARNLNSYSLLNQIIGRAARPDSECRIWEIVNPLARNNLDTTVVIGTPKEHKLVHIEKGQWIEEYFDYTSHR
jgi:superfamily II DNA or RNA helicase